jgi:HEAT repeat protein
MWELALLGLAASGGALWGWYQRHLRRLQFWQDVAASCGLNEVESFSVWNLYLSYAPQAGLAGVWIAFGENGIRVSIRFQGPPGFQDVKIRREPPRKSGSREIELGDEAFDRAFFVEGPTRLACALLDAETRKQLLSINVESELVLAGGMLGATMPEALLPRLLPLLLDLGRRFGQPMDLDRRLADNALRDPEPGVRLRNLLLLSRESPGDAERIEVFRAACSDASPRIRLQAAQELGSEGRDVLIGVAESTEDDASSAKAITILGRALPFERTRAILIQALRRRRLQTAQACLEALGRHGTTAAVDTLAKVMAREKGELATTATLALGMTGSVAAEPPLIRALGRDTPTLRVAAAKALGRVGSPAAVLPLKEMAERFADDRALGQACRQAIAEIQSRLAGASPGQLSLTAAEVGQLSLAQAEAGQLSLAAEPGGQLSLSPPQDEAGQLSLATDHAGQVSLTPDEPTPGGAA